MIANIISFRFQVSSFKFHISTTLITRKEVLINPIIERRKSMVEVMNCKKVFVLMLSLFLVLMVFPSSGSTSEVQYKLKISQDKPRGSSMSQNFVNNFCKPIEEMSGGRIKFVTFSWGELTPVNAIEEAVARKTLDLSISMSAAHPDWLGSSVGFGLPGGLITGNDWSLFLYDYGWRDYLQKNLYDQKGIYLLGAQVQPGQVVVLKKPISSMGDIKGKKLRSFGPNAALYSAFGASIANVAINETYQAIATGVVDGGTVGDYQSVTDMSLQEIIKCVIGEPAAPSSLALNIIINKQLWESLPADLKAIVQQATIAYTNTYYQKAVYAANEAEKVLKKAGVATYKLTDQERALWFKTADDYWSKLAQNPLHSESIKMLRAFMTKMGYKN